MRKIALLLLLVSGLSVALWVTGRHQTGSLAMPIVRSGADQATRGAAAFIGADFGGLSMDTLESNAVPWKLVAASLVIDAQRRDPSLAADRQTLDKILMSFGFLVDAKIANLPAGLDSPPGDLPFGMTWGELAPIAGAPVQVSNLGCAACHAGVTYDATGKPDPKAVWIGMPNSSLNLEAYTLTIFQALKTSADDPERLVGMVKTLFPETGWRERQTLRWLVMPLVRSRLTALQGDRPMPFPNGVPGSTNGVAALKHAFGVTLIDGGPGEAGIVSIPDLGHRHWRSSLLADGAYATPGTTRQHNVTVADNTPEHRAELAAITSFFTVPSMGVPPETAIGNIGAAEDVFAFLDTYSPQPFPGLVDTGLAQDGARIYADECSECHGNYQFEQDQPKLISFPNRLEDTGTDPLRAAAITPDLIARFATTPYRDVINVQATGAYVAQPLDGLWASAPYLHNGSVPTIRALLTPDERPETFELGGHALDFDNMGLLLEDGRYPEGYSPFSQPVLFDTRLPGQDNGGHDFGSELSDEEKRALIEFLKLL